MTTDIRTPSPYELASKQNRDDASYRLDRLRVNRASLAAESRIIRTLRNKRRGENRHALNYHRTTRVREQSRAAHLAWGFVLGTPYDAIEGPDTRKRVNAKAVAQKIAMALGHDPELEAFEAWLPTEKEQYLRSTR